MTNTTERPLTTTTYRTPASLMIGGLLYTAGGIVYAAKRPDPSPRWFGFHEVFHALTLVGFLLATFGFARMFARTRDEFFYWIAVAAVMGPIGRWIDQTGSYAAVTLVAGMAPIVAALALLVLWRPASPGRSTGAAVAASDLGATQS